MSKDQRVGRDLAEPDHHEERLWAAYLTFYREQLARAVLALTPGARRSVLVPSGWSPIEMLSHVLHMEQRWFVWGFLGERVAEPWGDWTVDEPWADGADGRWYVATDVTAERLAERLTEIGARTTEVLATHPLTARAHLDGRFAEDPPTLEWICFHVLAEYARHAGQLDVVIELSAGPGEAQALSAR